jgi:hypothetical protein
LKGARARQQPHAGVARSETVPEPTRAARSGSRGRWSLPVGSSDGVPRVRRSTLEGCRTAFARFPRVHQRAVAWSPPHEMAGGRNRRQSRTATPGRVPVRQRHSALSDRAEARSTTPTRGRCPFVASDPTLPDRSRERPRHDNARTGARLPPRIRASPAAKPMRIAPTATPGRCPFATEDEAPLAEASRDRTHGNARTVPVCHRGRGSVGRSQQRPHPRQRPDGARLPMRVDHSWPKPGMALHAATSRRVPGHRWSRGPRRPKPMRTLLAATSGRCPVTAGRAAHAGRSR